MRDQRRYRADTASADVEAGLPQAERLCGSRMMGPETVMEGVEIGAAPRLAARAAAATARGTLPFR